MDRPCSCRGDAPTSGLGTFRTCRRNHLMSVVGEERTWLGRGRGPAIALANKLPRIAWSVLARGRAFEASKLQAA